MKKKKVTTRCPDAMRQSGGGKIRISHKPSKKVKTLSSVGGGMDKLPKKLLDDSYAVNLISVPRKLRSVPSAGMSKRHIDQSTPNLMASADGNKKVIFNQDEHLMMKNEEEAIVGLLALAENDITNTHEIKLYNKFHDLNESRNILDVKKDCEDVKAGNDSRKRCSSHIYICQLIKKLENSKGKTIDSHKAVKNETTWGNAMKFNSGINLNEAVLVGKPVIQDEQSGYGAHSYFGNPYCDPSQWSRPMFPKQQMWMNPLMYRPTQLGSCVQGPLHNVQVSKHHASSGYDGNGVMFRVDSPPTLKLSL